MKLPALKEIIEERKEKAVETLSDSFAKNQLPLEEYERLVEYINKIESERELVVVEKIVAEHAGEKSTGQEPEDDDDDEDDDDRHSKHHSISANNLTILSTRSFSGPVRSGSQFLSILGAKEVRIRKADLKKQRTRLHMLTILGDSTIYVEPGIRVTNKVLPILGNAGISQKVSKMADAAPELVISGVAILGNIEVKLLKG